MNERSTFHGARKALLEGRTSMVELTRQMLERAHNKAQLNIFLELFDASALAKAVEVDAKVKAGNAGPLAGAVVSIKDNICYAGHRVSAASKVLEGYVSPYSATVVERLLAADAVIIGRTNCDEFAMGSSTENSAYGPASNPYNTAYVVGGSSGGAAASVAAGLCHIALASDTGGSIRQPASYCGVVGLKPTYGRVSRYGLIAFASSFDQVGPMAHDTADLQAVYQVIAGPDDRDNTTSHAPFAEAGSKEKLKIGYYAHCLEHKGMDPEIRAHMDHELQRWAAEGHTVEPVELPIAELMVPTYFILSTAEASSNLARFDGVRYGHRSAKAKNVDEVYTLSRTEGFGPEVQRRILMGTFVLSAGYYDAYYGKAQRVRRIIRDTTLEQLAKYDLIITPTGPSTAFKKGQIVDPVTMYLQDIFTVQANLAGVPAISVPAGSHTNGMPYGIQLMSAPFREEFLIKQAEQLFQRRAVETR